MCVSGLPVAFYLPFAYKKHNEARTLWQAARVQLLWCVCVVAAVVTYNFQTRVAIIWIGSASKNADTFFRVEIPRRRSYQLSPVNANALKTKRKLAVERKNICFSTQHQPTRSQVDKITPVWGIRTRVHTRLARLCVVWRGGSNERERGEQTGNAFTQKKSPS